MAKALDGAVGVTAALRCSDLVVSYGERVVLDRLDLEVDAGETVALLGPSGSGKTTLLYAVAGLLPVTSGEIALHGAVVSSVTPPEERSVGMVFQNYALWPHLDAISTVAYPLVRRGLDHAAARVEAARLLEVVGIGDLADRLPDQLSGGQQQRVGVARALAGRPDLYLFDEPTAHLDARLRDALQAELINERTRSGAAALYTSHDAEEALAVADRVAVMRSGRIVQIGQPADVYRTPVDGWVAGLTGVTSLLDAELVAVTDEAITALLGGQELEIEGGSAVPPGSASLVIRPDWASIGGPLSGSVAAVRYEGPHTDYLVEGPAGTVRIREAGVPRFVPGAAVGWTLERAWAVARDT